MNISEETKSKALEMAADQMIGIESGCPSYRPGGVVFQRRYWAALARLTGQPVTRQTGAGYAGYREHTTYHPNGHWVESCSGGVGSL